MEQELETLSGVAEELTFRREDTGFTVLDLSSDDGELITVVGVLPEVSPGEELKLAGHWDNHATFGRQFRAEYCERKMPATVAQMLKYLSSGSVKGIGPSTAAKIIDAFGEETFEVLAHAPDRLAEIRGISPNKAKQISREFQEQYAEREQMMALENFGLSPTQAIRASQVLGRNAVERLEENPYLLCSPEIGMSFEDVDRLAEWNHDQIASA